MVGAVRWLNPQNFGKIRVNALLCAVLFEISRIGLKLRNPVPHKQNSLFISALKI